MGRNDRAAAQPALSYSDDDPNYPPHSFPDPYTTSQDSFGNAPLTSGTEKVVRDRSNPYAQNYKGEPMSFGSWRKWLVATVIILVCAGIAAGIAVWRVDVNKKSKSGSANTGTSRQYINGTARVVKSNPQDPSDFEPDSRLHNNFYGIAYTPFLAQEPWRGATQANVTEDIQLLSQLTTRLRLYGGACNQTQLVLQAIQETKANMTIWIGSYIGSDTSVNAAQQQDAIDALKAYGSDHVSGVIIGNEYLLDSTDVTAATTLLFRTALKALSLPKTIPVGTADAGSMISATIAAGSDFFMANVHPFFGGLKIKDAAAWTNSYFTKTDVAVCKAASPEISCAIAETGWPTDSMTAANLTDEGATAGVPELQTFLDTFICEANTNGTAYFYFSPWDEPWKEQFGTVEPYWGLGDSNKIWKNITFPAC